MSPALPVILRGGNTLRDPRRLPGMAAWFDGLDPASLIYDGSNRTALLGDKSGNSAENGLVLNNAAGNNAGITGFSAFGTGNFTVVAEVYVNSLAALSFAMGGAANSFALKINTNGTLQSSKASVADNTASSGTVAVFGLYTLTYVRSSTTGTYYINAVSGGTTTDSQNYTTGMSWLGASGAGDNSLNGRLRKVRAYSVALDAAQVAADAAGTVQSNCTLNVDFTVQAKLATSFTATIGGTVTINTSGATGARIAGARDLYQGTVGSQPTYSLASRTLTFDGTDDWMKTAAFTLNQPTTVYFVGSQITWTAGDTLYDGNTNNTGHLQQDTATPRLRAFAGASLADIRPALGVAFLATVVFNGASGSIRLNANTATTGNTGASNMGGFTLGVVADFSTSFFNGTVNEIAIYNTAHTASQQQQFWAYARRRWGIAA